MGFLAFDILLGLEEREGLEMDFVRQTVVKSAVIVDHIANHPRGGRAADDEHDVVDPRAAAVPEEIQGMDEARILRIEARQFVDEHYQAFLCSLVLFFQ